MTVKQKQNLLAYLGYYTGEIDGLWGAQSQQATEAFQRDYQLTVDGVFGDGTFKRIREVIYNEEAPTVDKNAENDAVVDITPANADLEIKLAALFKGIRYWKPREIACRCGEYHAPYCNGFPVLPDRTLLELVDDIREKAGAPGIRSSGIRCYQHNIDSNGVKNSKHTRGKALDFMIEGMSGEQLLALALADPRTSYAYIINPGEPYVHVDVA